MLFKKTYDELVSQTIEDLTYNTSITNTNPGGTARTLLEAINLRLGEYYDVLELNHAMGFLSSAEGYFLDLIGELLNVERTMATRSLVTSSDSVQKFYVANGFLGDRIPSLRIPAGTSVSTIDGSIVYNVTEDAVFSAGAKEVYVSISASDLGSDYNVGVNVLVAHTMNIDGVFTTNEKSIVSGQDTESDNNYRFRIANATLSAEKANETAIRLAALSVDGVGNIIMMPYALGIGSYGVLVVPEEGLPNSSLINSVQEAIDAVQAFGIRGVASSPVVVPVDIEVQIVFIDGVPDPKKNDIRSRVKTSIEQYIVNIPIGGTFVYNELVQQIMDTSALIKDMNVHCYYFKEAPHLRGNISIEKDEMFYPNPNSSEAIRVF